MYPKLEIGKMYKSFWSDGGEVQFIVNEIVSFKNLVNVTWWNGCNSSFHLTSLLHQNSRPLTHNEEAKFKLEIGLA